MEHLLRLSNKVALVAGASRGIGKAIALALQRNGATVVGIGRSAAREIDLEELSSYIQVDIGDEASFSHAVASAASFKGSLDIYVHCAGVSLPSGADLAEEVKRFTSTISSNLVDAYRCSATAADAMDSDRGGAIVLISSINSQLGFPGNPGYVASKGGVTALTRSLAVDLGAHNIRVNSIAPGYIKTEMTKASFDDLELRQSRLDRMILNRWGNTEDIAGVAVFLSSGEASYITGQEIIVDGGWTAKGL